MYKKGKVIFATTVVTFVFCILPAIAFPLTLVRVGYIDLNRIIKTYTTKYLQTEIDVRQKYISQLNQKYYENYYTMTTEELNNLQLELKDQGDVLSVLQNNKFYWDSNGEITDHVINQIIQRDIMEAIKKTGEVEGFNLIIDNTGNFVYGSEDINLTDKVLFRLDEKLLDLQNAVPRTPLSRELEVNPASENRPKNTPAVPSERGGDTNSKTEENFGTNSTQ